MSMIFPTGARAGRPDVFSSAFAAIEFELALDLADLGQDTFETCVARAAASANGQLLFAVPASADLEGISMIAAVRLPSGTGSKRDGAIVFAVMDDNEDKRIRLADRQEVGEHFYGFAKAYAGVMDRLRPVAEG